MLQPNSKGTGSSHYESYKLWLCLKMRTPLPLKKEREKKKKEHKKKTQKKPPHLAVLEYLCPVICEVLDGAPPSTQSDLET